MDKLAVVTLSALSGDVSLAERRITLDPNNPTIPIGRASKTPEKGLLAAVDNAWFASPVMSREHAEMCLNPQLNVLTIHDLKSMHGTFLNNKKLTPKEPTHLSDGDKISFGAEVSRGVDVFTPCTFRVNIDFLPYRAPNSYTFPDSSDVEEGEEDNDLSDDEMEDDRQAYMSSEDDVSIELQSPLKVSQAINAIDLTRDESPYASSNRVDLTDEIAAPTAATQGGNTYQAYAEDPIVVDSDDNVGDRVDFLSGSDDQSLIGDSSNIESSEDEELPEIDDDESGVGEDSEDAGSVLDGSFGEVRETTVNEIDGVYRSTGPTLLPICTGSESLEAPEKPEDMTDYDDESDLGLSEAGAEGIKALFSDGLLNSDSGLSEHVPNKEALSHANQDVADASQHNHHVFALGQVGNETQSSASQAFRQPSPSDAAMVKTATYITPHMAANQVFTFHVDNYNNPGQTLGEKTGKHAFFEAREGNKAKVNAPVTKDDSPDVRPHLAHGNNLLPQSSIVKAPAYHTTYQPWASRPTDNLLSQATVGGEPSLSITRVDDLAPRRFTPSLNFDTDAQLPVFQRAPSPEYDMTSAVAFNESKAKSIRSRLSIRDIIESSSRDETAQKSGSRAGEKRKASEISNVVDEELREWASLDASKPSKVASSNTKIITSIQPVATQPDEQRPTKKLKTVLERVGYAAVGGMAVGAGLFFGLVATAPDFI